MADPAVIGDTPRRREDARFVTGQGAYLDDLRFEGLAHAVFIRSPHAQARIIAVGSAEALRTLGVVALLTSDGRYFAGTPCTTNPVGGEAGAIALFPAIGHAIADGVDVTGVEGPASAFHVWQAMRTF